MTATTTMIPRPMAKRTVCRDAQGSKLPLAAENSMATPIPAVAQTSRTNSQWICQSLRPSDVF